MDRLLTNNEMIQLMWDFAQTVSDEDLDKLQQIDRFQMIAKAQDLKTSQWWVGKIEQISTECFEGGCKYEDGICRLMTYGSKHACLPWLSLKHEAGI